ncbi:MAG: carboxymuconolactone decarboxylase family protein [Cytophagaceae bacterium]|nr:carboxymuconolactone decarboxylase family protein [Cytophagaceae bacterium]
METKIANETVENLFRELDLTSEHVSKSLEKLMQSESRYIKDLKINVSNSLNSKHLSKKESLLIGFAVALNEKNSLLAESFERMAVKEGASEAEIAEVTATTSLMNTNNVFYRFRHFMDDEFYTQTQAGIKMTIMMNPVLGKEFFELLSLVISSLNGCEMCVRSHEESVKNHGASKERIFDAVKLGSIIKGLTIVL